jgi:hypothetical protein
VTVGGQDPDSDEIVVNLRRWMLADQTEEMCKFPQATNNIDEIYAVCATRKCGIETFLRDFSEDTTDSAIA